MYAVQLSDEQYDLLKVTVDGAYKQSDTLNDQYAELVAAIEKAEFSDERINS